MIEKEKGPSASAESEKKRFQYAIQENGIGDARNIWAASLEEAQAEAERELNRRKSLRPESEFSLVNAQEIPEGY